MVTMNCWKTIITTYSGVYFYEFIMVY